MSPSTDLVLRTLTSDAHDEIDLVATRMRRTLEEVLGEETGRAMYTMDWLRDRVRFHLDARRSTAAVFLADRAGAVLGHTIVRLERDEAGGHEFGLFSTTYVMPEARRSGIASRLLARGEAWMRERALSFAATDTAANNHKLIGLYESHGYAIVLRAEDMVRLGKPL